MLEIGAGEGTRLPSCSTTVHLTNCTFIRLRIGESLSTGTMCTPFCTSAILIVVSIKLSDQLSGI